MSQEAGRNLLSHFKKLEILPCGQGQLPNTEHSRQKKDMMIRACRELPGDGFQDRMEAEMSGTTAAVQAWGGTGARLGSVARCSRVPRAQRE